MTLWRNLFLIFVTMLLGLWGAPLMAAEGISVQESLRAGLDESQILASRRQEFLIARQTVGVAGADRDLTGRLSLSEAEVRTDSAKDAGGYLSDESRQGSISLSKQIFDFGETRARLKSAHYGIDQARAHYAAAEQQVVLDIISAHLAVITAQKAFMIQQANVARLEAQTEATRIRLNAGSSTPTRLAEAEARLARAISQHISSESDLLSAKEAYRSLTKRTDFALADVILMPDDLPKGAIEAQDMATEFHPAIAAAKAVSKQTSLNFDILKKSLLPKVTLSVTASSFDRGGIEMDKDEIVSKIELTTPILSTKGSRAASRRNVASHSQAKLNLAETTRTVRLSALQAFRAYEAASAQLAAVEAENKAAALVATGTAEEVQFGLKTFLDQLDAEQDLSDAELRLVQTKQAILLNGFRLLQAVGKLEAARFIGEEGVPSLDALPAPPTKYFSFSLE